MSESHATPADGLWSLVILNSPVFILFAFRFAKPRSRRDWRSFGAFSAFLVALFTERYGFPLTIDLLMPWLSQTFPGIDFLSHGTDHLLETILGWRLNPHVGAFHFVSNVLIAGGFLLLAASWKVLYAAQRAGTIATSGPYARLRHPQYAGFVLILFGFLLPWPTLVTVLMFPVLVTMYALLAMREEQDALARFGPAYRDYAQHVPAFIPRRSHRVSASDALPPR